MKGMINFHRITRERQRQGKQPKGTRKRRQRRQRILNRQFLMLTETMQDTAKALHALAPASPTNDPAQEPDETDILSVLYSGDYFPKSHMSIKDDPLDKNARKTQEALRATFSPEQGKDKNFHAAGQKRRAIATGDPCRLLRRLPKPPVLFAAASYCCAIKRPARELKSEKKGRYSPQKTGFSHLPP